MISKSWKIRSSNGKKLEFIPVFKVTGKDEHAEVETESVIIKIDGEEYALNFVNLFQFVYFVANEELRQGLLLRHQKQVNYIPYEVSFQLDNEEVQKKFAKRRINLPVDELIMAIARNEAWKLMPNVVLKLGQGIKPGELFKGRKN